MLVQLECPDYVRELIRKTQALTDKPFGVGVVLAFPHEENIKAVLDEKVALLQVYWGEFPKEHVLIAHKAGVKIVHQVGSYEEAEKAIKAGVDAIIVQGREAGGHVIGQDGWITLLPRVVDLAAGHSIPIIAAGSIVDGRGYVAALALGAQGVCLGTRFLATEESYAHPTYKRKLVELNKTEYTNIFGRARWPGAPHRVLQTPFFIDWKLLPDHENEANQPVIGRSTIHGTEKRKYAALLVLFQCDTTGDIESMVMYAGERCWLIKEILPAGEVVIRLVEEAKHVIRQQFSDASVM
ncbi:hypothetical protein AQUCO_08900022v1 [Aquilegia coerulea]|uniref:Uncharacterized protein n=1 Tax=Aquilegia coerulea TaxID=218851 RepID=A0A2G5C662_AQUCA|nr:hypothetical protein AQUCO_08900022v1 [Aquilegia coerulea]